VGARSGLAFWECPHHKAQDKGYHKPTCARGRFFHVFLMIEKDLTPTYRCEIP
jgi:hypothetical protein